MDARKILGTGPSRGAGPVEYLSTSPAPLSAEQVYHDYAPRVYNMARRMVASDVDAEDVTQDVLLQVVRKLPSFRGESAFPTWLHRVTVNAALSHRRREAGRQESALPLSLPGHGEDGSFEAPDERAPGPDAEMLERECKQLVEEAIDALPDSYRVVFVLADVEGLTGAEVARRLGMSLPAVKSRLHRARLMLRDALAPHFDRTA
jgi:RNA polymerase sigma-70 factor (ECF subfamily)